MIELRQLTKRYGRTTAVERLTCTVQPGRVTGFLGPNGAGKSTTMRMVVGLDRPTRGTATVAGRPYRSLASPLRTVGTLLDAGAMHPGRRARDHLWSLAQSNGIPPGRVDEVLEQVGLTAVATGRTGGYSLGMRQRLGLAAALLGDPEVLILDEPVNGLDTEGIRWIRHLLSSLAEEGRTILLSSHLMSEMERTADHLILNGRGRLLADGPIEDLLGGPVAAVSLVRTPQPEALWPLLGATATVEPDGEGRWRVTGPDPATIGDLAARGGVALHELTPQRSSLEDVYTRMVDDVVAHRGAA